MKCGRGVLEGKGREGVERRKQKDRREGNRREEIRMMAGKDGGNEGRKEQGWEVEKD